MNTEPSLKKNIAISTVYQLLLIILPLITAPYIARVLGPDQSGIYDFTTSIQTYFSMFAALGTATYGAREIARVRNDITRRSVLFWEIELMTVMTSAACVEPLFKGSEHLSTVGKPLAETIAVTSCGIDMY